MNLKVKKKDAFATQKLKHMKPQHVYVAQIKNQD